MAQTAPVVAPTLEEFEVAHANVAQVAIQTPVLHSHYLTELVGQEVFLKCENLQRTGAYKLRGAYHERVLLQPALATTPRVLLSPLKSSASRQPSLCRLAHLCLSFRPLKTTVLR